MPTARHIYAAIDQDVAKYDSADLSTYVWKAAPTTYIGNPAGDGASIGVDDNGKGWYANQTEENVVEVQFDGVTYGAESLDFKPWAVTADDSGNYWVGGESGTLVKFDSNGEVWSSTLSGKIRALMWHGGYLYASVQGHGLHVVNATGYDSQIDQYTEPMDMASGGGYVYFGEYNSYFEDYRLTQYDGSVLTYASLGSQNWNVEYSSSDEFVALAADGRGVYVSLAYDDMLMVDTAGTQQSSHSLTGTVRDFGAGDSYTFTDNAAPTAAFAYSKSNGTVDFTDQSSDGDGTIASYSWDFGDGTTSTAQSPSHTYASSGTYTATLTVTDDAGATATATQDIAVTVVIGGTASVSNKGEPISSAGSVKSVGSASAGDQSGQVSLQGDLPLSTSVLLEDEPAEVQATTLPGQRAESLYMVEDGNVVRRSAKTGAVQETLLSSSDDSYYTVEAESNAGDFYVLQDVYGETTLKLKKYDSAATEIWSVSASRTFELTQNYLLYADAQDYAQDVIKADKNGTAQWTWTHPVTGTDTTTPQVSFLAAGGGEQYAAVRESIDDPDYNYKTHLFNVTGGTTQWSKTLDGKIEDMAAGPSGELYVAADPKLDNPFRKYDSTGSLVFSDYYVYDSLDVDIFGNLYTGDRRSVEGPGWQWELNTSDGLSGKEIHAEVQADNGRHAYAVDTYTDNGTGLYGLTMNGETDWKLLSYLPDSFAVPRPNVAPAASFEAVTDGLQISFNEKAQDYDGTVQSYSWDFGDGTTSANPNPSHTYASGGSYTVTLTVTDDQGATDSNSFDVGVAPIVHASASLLDQSAQLSLQGKAISSGSGSATDKGESVQAVGAPYVSASTSLTDDTESPGAEGGVLSSGSALYTAGAAVLSAIGTPVAAGGGGAVDAGQNVGSTGRVLASLQAGLADKDTQTIAGLGGALASAIGQIEDSAGQSYGGSGDVLASASLAHTDVFGEFLAAGNVLTSGSGGAALTAGEIVDVLGDLFAGGTGDLAFTDTPAELTSTGGVLASGHGSTTSQGESLSGAGLVLSSGASAVEGAGHVLTLGGRVLASGQGSARDQATILLISGSIISRGAGAATVVDALQEVSASGAPIAGATASLTDTPQLFALSGKALAAAAASVADSPQETTASGLVKSAGGLSAGNLPYNMKADGNVLASGQLSAADEGPAIWIATFVGRKPDSITTGLRPTITIDTDVQSSL